MKCPPCASRTPGCAPYLSWAVPRSCPVPLDAAKAPQTPSSSASYDIVDVIIITHARLLAFVVLRSLAVIASAILLVRASHDRTQHAARTQRSRRGHPPQHDEQHYSYKDPLCPSYNGPGLCAVAVSPVWPTERCRLRSTQQSATSGTRVSGRAGVEGGHRAAVRRHCLAGLRHVLLQQELVQSGRL